MRFKEIYLVILLLAAIAVLFIIWSLQSTGSHAGADDLFHTEIAKYSWKYPHLLLDHWGKPFYTIVASPFAQFGNPGTKMMNILFALLSAFLAYATCRQLNYRAPWMAIIMVMFAPIYTVLALSGNIEIFAGLIAIASVYFYSKDKYIIGNIILSFGFFVRNELFIFIPFFLIYNILRKKYKAIPFVLTGFVLYSIIGYFYYHDIFWVINKIPYGNTKELVGTGSLFHYVNQSKLLFGIPETIFLVIGLLFIIIGFLRKKFTFEKTSSFELFVILLPFLAYYGGHSFLFWKGAGGSGGAMRVMASVAPLAALIAMRGLSPVLEWIKKIKPILYYPVGLIFLIIVAITPTKVHEIPVPAMEDLVLLRQTADWYKDSEYNGSYLIWGDPRITTMLDIDPFDEKSGRWYLHDSIQLEKFIPDGAIFIWDAHFSTNFGKTQLDRVMRSKYYKLIKVFESSYNYKALGGYDYAIYIFQKHSGEVKVDNFKILDQLRDKEEESFILFRKLDFENISTPPETYSKRSYSGIGSFMIGANDAYSPVVELSGKDFIDMETRPKKLKVSVKIKVDTAKLAQNIILVSSFQKNEKSYAYYSSNSLIPDSIAGWSTMEIKFPMPVIRSKKDVIKFYIWNQGNYEFVIDDLAVFLKNGY